MATGFRKNCGTGQVEEYEYTPPAAVVPDRVTRHQFIASLTAFNAGRRGNMTSWLAQGGTPQAYKDALTYARNIERISALVTALKSELNMNDAQMDTVFLNALQYDE